MCNPGRPSQQLSAVPPIAIDCRNRPPPPAALPIQSRCRALRRLSTLSACRSALLRWSLQLSRFAMLSVLAVGSPIRRQPASHSSGTARPRPADALLRGSSAIIRSGETINIPANAPHQFQNKSGKPARLLCLCSPAGQEEFFREVGVPVATRTTPPPPLDREAEAAFAAKVKALAPKYRTELLCPQYQNSGPTKSYEHRPGRKP
jgi:hypothetical protein